MARVANFPARRRAEIVDLLRHRGQSTVTELCLEFAVSEDTIRRDLDFLSTSGAISRTHGGAILAESERLNANLPFERRLAHSEAKARIGEVAAELVDEGQTVFINGGTTTLAVARSLAATRGLTVVTNNLRLPELLYSHGAREVYVLGGAFRLRSLVTIGPIALPDEHGQLHALHADLSIIGVGGVADNGILSTTSLPEAGMIRSMIHASSRTIIVADSSKFGRTQFAQITRIDSTMTLVTEKQPSAALLAQASECGTQVRVTDPPAELGLLR